jgi:TetR/AcrR family transcriptional regulator, mexJK operon transcriptional repressor
MVSKTIEPPLGKREARKQDRRQAIVAVARRSFLEKGYAATSMSGLLAELGGSKATLWSYFRSKEELFAAVVEEETTVFREELEGSLSASADLETTLEAFCRSFMKRTADPDAMAAWRLIVGESGRFPELGRIFYERAAMRVERALAGYLAEQIASGRLRDEGAMNMARVLLGFCATQHDRRLWGVSSQEPDEAETDARRFTDYFLRLFAAEAEA